MKKCLLFSGIKNRRRAPGMALKLWQIWLVAGLITPAPACFLESCGEADGAAASPAVPGDGELPWAQHQHPSGAAVNCY